MYREDPNPVAYKPLPLAKIMPIAKLPDGALPNYGLTKPQGALEVFNTDPNPKPLTDAEKERIILGILEKTQGESWPR